MCKKVVLTYLKLVSHFARGAEEHHEETQIDWRAYGPGFEPRTYRYEAAARLTTSLRCSVSCS
jgi:hypothetical protein